MTDYDTLVKEYAQLTDQKNSIDERLDAIKAELRGLGAGSHSIAGLTVSISPTRRIDETKIALLYPISSHPELYTAKPDPKKLRAELPAKVVDTLMHEVGEPRVSVR